MNDIGKTVAFITGGAQGIGLGMARAFAREGAKLALADIDDAALRAAESELSAATEVEGFHLDVRDRDAYARTVDEAEERLGMVTVLCNNAGIDSQTPIESLSYEQWDLALGINLGGVMNGVQTVLPRMLDRGGPGHIVNTASGAGLFAILNFTYTTSKFAVVGMSESLRRQPELAANRIGVTVVCPGFVRTDIERNSARIMERRDPDCEEGQTVLQRYGLDPDVVGEQVLAAVRADELYVLTDRTMAPMIEARTQALLAALPEETERDRELAWLVQQRRAQAQEATDSDR